MSLAVLLVLLRDEIKIETPIVRYFLLTLVRVLKEMTYVHSGKYINRERNREGKEKHDTHNK